MAGADCEYESACRLVEAHGACAFDAQRPRTRCAILVGVLSVETGVPRLECTTESLFWKKSLRDLEYTIEFSTVLFEVSGKRSSEVRTKRESRAV